MPDEDNQEAKRKRIIESYNAKLASGEPMMDFALDEILEIHTLPTGEALIEFVFGQSPDNRAIIARLAVSREAARILKAALVKNENIPDTPPSKRDPRSTN